MSAPMSHLLCKKKKKKCHFGLVVIIGLAERGQTRGIKSLVMQSATDCRIMDHVA